MDSTVFKKLALPAALVVSSFASANACRDEVHCVDIEKKKKCESEPSCQWNAQDGYCESACYSRDNQSDCEAISGCVWDADGGSGGESGETGESVGSCHEPFT